MRKMLQFSVFVLVVGLMVNLAGCSDGGDGDDPGPGPGPGGGGDGINWTNQASGTLTVINNVSKDMVLFQGQTPTANNILGGVRALTTRTFDISNAVTDFSLGGYIVLRGMALDEYNKNKTNLANAKIEYSAMATYGQGKNFRTEINPAYAGEYYFKVTNGGRIGIELRKDSPDGEKIGYLPALATNYALYASSSNDITIFPVYVFYSSITKNVTTIKPTSFGDSASIGPRPVTDTGVSTVRFPNDPNIQWAQIIANITYPVAFVTVTNNVANQSCRLAAASRVYFAQNGYDSVNSGQINTFEITATDVGQSMNLNMTLYGGTVTIPIKQGDSTPVIKNGYDYTVTINYSGGGWDTVSAYTATITEGSKRDVSTEISSL
ncbi:MAG: hypothetical protein LBB89_00715 [Treponema sp.]|jgi:hypothetical protein|nr:hypothetical protein [Treponema sp.]